MLETLTITIKANRVNTRPVSPFTYFLVHLGGYGLRTRSSTWGHHIKQLVFYIPAYTNAKLYLPWVITWSHQAGSKLQLMDCRPRVLLNRPPTNVNRAKSRPTSLCFSIYIAPLYNYEASNAVANM